MIRKTILLIIFVVYLKKFAISTSLLSRIENLFLSIKTEDQSKEITNQTKNITKQPPIITELNLKTNISNRFATTLVTSKVRNENSYATEVIFFIFIPANAYVSDFIMEIDEKPYKAYVKEKKEDFFQAFKRDFRKVQLAASARDSNKFAVSVNLEPESNATFYLTYQELLVRQKGQYELVLNINPEQIVKNLNIQVNINESRPITFVRSPSLRSGNETGKTKDTLDPLADIVINNLTAIVKFNPSLQKQKEYIKEFKNKEENGLSAQFVVQYDVKHDPFGGEIFVHDGYFIHFFAPSDLPRLPKQIIFVLDTSGSMEGAKLDQLKEAMENILLEVEPEDSLSIVEFYDYVKVWDIANGNHVELKLRYEDPYGNLSSIFKEKYIAPSVPASQENIRKSINIIRKLMDHGTTNIMGGLEVALFLANENLDKKLQPIIYFLTDGVPSTGVSHTKKIIELVTKINSGENRVPIFSLSFGHEADREFVEKLSLKNAGFARHIYEGADAALQLQEFYKLISFPLLRNVTFKYTNSVKEVTKRRYPLIFDGSELVIAGKTDDPKFSIGVNGFGPSGPINLTPVYEKPVDNLEKLWAYLTVKQLLSEKEIFDNNKTEITRKALDLALKYSLLTPITSMVVVKPTRTDTVDTENADTPKSETLFVSFRFYTLPVTTNAIISDKVSWLPVNVSKQVFAYDEDSSINPFRLPLPWLHKVINPNGTLTIPNIGTFELGFDGDIVDQPKCPKSVLNFTNGGICRLIDDCHEMQPFLNNLQTIIEYYCPLDPYVGICCPRRKKFDYDF